MTTAKNSVNNIRDTQAKWDTMSATDRQRVIDENEDFFNIEGAHEAFYNGEDILNENIDYLVIDIMTLDNNNKFLGYFLFLSRIKEKNEKNNIYSIDDD